MLPVRSSSNGSISFYRKDAKDHLSSWLLLYYFFTLSFVVDIVPTLASGLGVFWQWPLGIEIYVLWIHFTL